MSESCRPLTVLSLPVELLTHILNFESQSTYHQELGKRKTRLDGEIWRITKVSTLFRKAFYESVVHLDLRSPHAHRLAQNLWRPLEHCIFLRKIVVDHKSGLSDQSLTCLFAHLYANGIRLQSAEVYMGDKITILSMLEFSRFFSLRVQELKLVYSRSRSSTGNDSNAEQIQQERDRIEEIMNQIQTSDPSFGELGRCPLLDPRTRSFGKALSCMANLRTLRLTFIDVVNSDTLKSLEGSLIYLQELHISYIEDLPDLEMSLFVAPMKKLRRIFFSKAGYIGDQTINAICAGESRRTLRDLSVDGLHNLSDRAIRNVGLSCLKLREIDINRCQLVTGSALRGFSAHPCLEKISVMDLSFSVNDSDFELFGRSTPMLEYICISPCSLISYRSIRTLSGISSLRNLYLDDLIAPSRRFLYEVGNLQLDCLTLKGLLRLSPLSVRILLGRKRFRPDYLHLVDHSRVLDSTSLGYIIELCPNVLELRLRGNFSAEDNMTLQESLPGSSVFIEMMAEIEDENIMNV